TRSTLTLFATLFAACFPILPHVPAEAQDVLRPEAAYPYSVEANEDRLVVRFDVVDGYYLYRERFDFASITSGVELRTVDYPSGILHSDEFFGEQEIYRGSFEIEIPYSRSGRAESMELEVRLQGCADIGL